MNIYILVEVNFERFEIHQLAGCTLLAAEAASHYHAKACLHLDDVTELILAGAFSGINEIYLLKPTHIDSGLIIYLRQAVKALKIVEMPTVENPLLRQQKREKSFAPAKPSILRQSSLFRPGLVSVSEISEYNMPINQ